MLTLILILAVIRNYKTHTESGDIFVSGSGSSVWRWRRGWRRQRQEENRCLLSRISKITMMTAINKRKPVWTRWHGDSSYSHLLLCISRQEFFRSLGLWAETCSYQTATLLAASADPAECQGERLYQRLALAALDRLIITAGTQRTITSWLHHHKFAWCHHVCAADNVFGCHLDTLCHREHTIIPRFVVKCIKTVEKRGKLAHTRMHRHTHGHTQPSAACVQVWILMGSTEWAETWLWSRNYATKLITVTNSDSSCSLLTLPLFFCLRRWPSFRCRPPSSCGLQRNSWTWRMDSGKKSTSSPERWSFSCESFLSRCFPSAALTSSSLPYVSARKPPRPVYGRELLRPVGLCRFRGPLP